MRESAQNDPLKTQLDEANRRIGEWVMEVEIHRKERITARGLRRLCCWRRGARSWLATRTCGHRQPSFPC